MQRVGSRCQVMHGNAKMTGGGLKKKDLKYNKQGKIVSKKMSTLAKKKLQKAGYTTKKGQVGAVRSMRGGGIITVTIEPDAKAANLFEGFPLNVERKITINELKTQIIKQINVTLSKTAEKLGIVKKTLSEEPTTLSLFFYNKHRKIEIENPTLNSTLADYGFKNGNIITVEFMCPYWASRGECDKSGDPKIYMEDHCKAECQCTEWASLGECDKPGDPKKYMNHHCKDACDLVEKIKKKWEFKKKTGRLIRDTKFKKLLLSNRNNNGNTNSNSLNNSLNNKAYKKNLEKIKKNYKDYSSEFKLYRDTDYITIIFAHELKDEYNTYFSKHLCDYDHQIRRMKEIIRDNDMDINNTVPNLNEKIEKMKADIHNVPYNIFVYLYTVDNFIYHVINNAMREYTLNTSAGLFNDTIIYYIISINRYIYNNSVGRTIHQYNSDTLQKEKGYNVVWRGTQLSGINSDIFDSFKTFRISGYVSTSSVYTVAKSFYESNMKNSDKFPIMLKILFRDDCEYIAPISYVSSKEKENEYLIKPYTLFYMVGKMKIKDGRITYTLLISNNKSQKEFIDSIVLDASLPINVLPNIATEAITPIQDIIRLVSYNVHMNVDDKSARIKNINDLNGDIYLLQEATTTSKDDLQGRYSYKFEKSKHRDYGQGIYISKVIQEDCFKVKYLPDGDTNNLDTGYKSCIILEYAYFVIICVHLDVHDKTGAKRVNQVKKLIPYITTHYKNRPVILGGDFNAHIESDYSDSDSDLQIQGNKKYLSTNLGKQHPLDFKTIETIKSYPIFSKGDSLEQLSWKKLDKFTSIYNNRIDYFFTSPEVTLSDAGVYNDSLFTGSDHCPIWMDMPICLYMDDFKDIRDAHREYGGSNPKKTGIYIKNNKKYILKGPTDRDIVTNEVIASKLYQLAGIKVPNLTVLINTETDEYYVASELVENYIDLTKKVITLPNTSAQIRAQIRKNLLQNPTYREQILGGFFVDVWLSNWDVAGDEKNESNNNIFNNIGIVGRDNRRNILGEIIRVDVGGALLFRARGGLKLNFDNIPTEEFLKPGQSTSKLFDTPCNPSLTNADCKQRTGLTKLSKINKKHIIQTIDLYEGLMGPALIGRLRDVLGKRLDYLLKSDNYKQYLQRT
jgi:endonuclease/exonuclease/phosphatase family metal-dependent hydrolase